MERQQQTNWMIVFPSMFTLSSVLCGMLSMYVAAHAADARSLSVAAWLIVGSMIFDGVDGRVARATHATSAFGAELDSLADAVSFGVAPAWLMFNWGLEPLGAWGVVIAFVYVACTLVRLARFNVMAHQDESVRRYFTGLPSPLAAGGVVAIVVAQLAATGQATTKATFSVALLAILLGGLMVSNVRYRTYKDINFRGKGGIALLTLVVLTLCVGVVAHPSIAIVMLMMLYIMGGLVGGIASLGRHLFIHDDGPEGDLIFDEDTGT